MKIIFNYIKSNQQKMSFEDKIIDVTISLSKVFPRDIVKIIIYLAFQKDFNRKNKLYNAVVIKKNYPENLCNYCFKDWSCRYKCCYCDILLCPECYTMCKCNSIICPDCSRSHDRDYCSTFNPN